MESQSQPHIVSRSNWNDYWPWLKSPTFSVLRRLFLVPSLKVWKIIWICYGFSPNWLCFFASQVLVGMNSIKFQLNRFSRFNWAILKRLSHFPWEEICCIFVLIAIHSIYLTFLPSLSIKKSVVAVLFYGHEKNVWI